MKILVKGKVKESSVAKIIELLLKIRGIDDEKGFLSPKHPLEISLLDFGFDKEFEKALEILSSIRKTGKRVVVYTDYDADGITGGAILWETLYLLGFDVMPYVPDRKTEGYGFSIKGLKKVKNLYDPALIISVDHGISAKEKIEFAKKELGIPVIITDHHLKPEKMPTEAEAIFHTSELSGAGVSYFFSKAIYEKLKDRSTPKKIDNFFEQDYLSLASIGTIADLVPLLGASRSLAKYGLLAFENLNRLGLLELIKSSGIEGRKITPWEIGFIIAPRINAVGRLEDATDALRLLCTRNLERARRLAKKLSEKNKIRQNMVEIAVEKAKEYLEKNYGKKLPKLLIVYSKDFHEGIIGLVASKLVEEYNRPAIVFTSSNGFLKASARSIEKFHITDFLRSISHLLLEVGGHSQAAGLKMEEEKFQKFENEALNQAEKLLKEEDLQKVLKVDLELPVEALSLELVEALEKLSPFGVGNPEPKFLSEIEVVSARFFGKKNDHLKIFGKRKDEEPFEFILFGGADYFFKLSRGGRIKVVYTLEKEEWRGRKKARGKVSYIEI